MDSANIAAMIDALETRGMATGDIERLFHTFNAWAPSFRDAGVAVEPPRRRPHDR